MDIKNTLEFDEYKKASTLNNEALFNNVKESITYIKSCKLPYEFRTTVVPTIHDKQSILNIAEYIEGAEKYALQNFQPENTLDAEFEKLTPFSVKDIEEMAESIKFLVSEVLIRTKG
jgi:pyruvate formate lyase activating enzyme